MANVESRISINGKHFEILVDLDEALKVQKGEGDINLALQSQNIFTDLKKGNIASGADLNSAFETEDILKVAEKIIKNGEVQKTQEFRDDEKEKIVKQVVSLILQNAVDQHGNPYTEERLRSAISQVNYRFDNNLPEKQMIVLVSKLKEVIPIKIETRKIKLTIPAQFTGKVYAVVSDYKESEEWLSNGDLEIIVNVPAGSQIDFYEKLNLITHGAVQSEEISSE